MTNVTNLSSRRPLPTAAPQQSGNLIESAKRDMRHTRSGAFGVPPVFWQSDNTITLQQALATGATADQLRAVADWNERKSYDERRRKARSRHKAQALALREVAGRMEIAQHMQEAA